MLAGHGAVGNGIDQHFVVGRRVRQRHRRERRAHILRRLVDQLVPVAQDDNAVAGRVIPGLRIAVADQGGRHPWHSGEIVFPRLINRHPDAGRIEVAEPAVFENDRHRLRAQVAHVVVVMVDVGQTLREGQQETEAVEVC